MTTMRLEVRRAGPDDGAGDRPPLLFVHGAWHGAWCWAEHFLPWFAAAGWECVAPSLTGHGGSPGHERRNRLRLRDYVDDVIEVVAALDRPPVVLGHSMGGGVVQHLLARPDRPALAGAALLASMPPRGVWPVTLKVARERPGRFLRANARLDLGVLVETVVLARELFFSDDLPEVEVARHQRRLHAESYLAFLDMLVLDRPRPGPVDEPVLVLAAADDTIFSIADAEATAAAWSGDLTVVPHLAHDVMLDTGWESAAGAVLDWLEDRVLS